MDSGRRRPTQPSSSVPEQQSGLGHVASPDQLPGLAEAALALNCQPPEQPEARTLPLGVEQV